MKSQIRPGLTLFVLLTVFTGVAYPALVTGHRSDRVPRFRQRQLAQGQNVRLRTDRPTVRRFELFLEPAFSDRSVPTTARLPAAQTSARPIRICSRRSMNASRRSATRILSRTGRSPVDLVTASASGLDPHISPATAEYQVCVSPRRADKPPTKSAGWLPPHRRTNLGLLGEPRVNVLKLNLALDGK